MKSDTMELNRETAMELWKKQFGKTAKAVDYAGREILKAAYDDRGSEYGWNVDHILPKSRGGKTAEHNLICCHMATNSEKADKFPCFTANDTQFEIRKVQNHYEIVALGDAPVDFFDADDGVGFWDRCCKAEDDFWEGYLTICFDALDRDVDRAFAEFVEKLFENESVSLQSTKPAYRVLSANYDSIHRRRLLLRVHGLNLKKDIQRVLDLCVLLNTYMLAFFSPQKLLGNYSLFYDVKDYKNMLQALCDQYGGGDFGGNGLVISETVKANTDLQNKPLRRNCLFMDSGSVYAYDYYFSGLKKELEEI